MQAKLTRLLLRLAGRLPLPVGHATGGVIGWLVWLLPTRLARSARENIARCYPEMDDPQTRTLARASLVHAGRALADAAVAWTRSPTNTCGLIRDVYNEDLLDQAIAAGDGVILATPHIGAWEVAGVYLAHRVPFTAMYRPPRMQALDPILRASRDQAGLRSASTDGRGIRQLHRALMRGEAIGILPDQAPRGGGGVLAPFFHEPALTMTLLPRLANRTGAAVLYVIMERLPRGRGYALHFFPASQATASEDLEVAATAMNRDIAACINCFPEQYNWSYRRFRRRSGNRHASRGTV